MEAVKCSPRSYVYAWQLWGAEPAEDVSRNLHPVAACSSRTRARPPHLCAAPYATAVLTRTLYLSSSHLCSTLVSCVACPQPISRTERGRPAFSICRAACPLHAKLLVAFVQPHGRARSSAVSGVVPDISELESSLPRRPETHTEWVQLSKSTCWSAATSSRRSFRTCSSGSGSRGSSRQSSFHQLRCCTNSGH